MAGVENDLEAQAQIVRRDIQVCADLLQPVAHRNHPVTCVSPFREIRWQADTVIANINDDLAIAADAAFDGDFDRGAAGVGVAISVGNDFANHIVQRGGLFRGYDGSGRRPGAEPDG